MLSRTRSAPTRTAGVLAFVFETRGRMHDTDADRAK